MDSINKLIFENHISLIDAISRDDKIMDALNQSVDMIVSCFQNGQKVLIAGNGGSAADAEHIAAELSGKFKLNRKALYAEALHVNSAALTAISNDYSFEKVFTRMIEAKAQKEDVIIFFSTSGKSANIIDAMKYATSINCNTISFSGEDNSQMLPYSHLNFCIPSSETARIQECYMLICHIICERVEKTLFSNQ